MTEKQLKENVINAIIEFTETEEEVTEDTLIVRELGLSSMEVMVFVSDLEDEFDIDLPAKLISKVKTVGDLCEVIIEQLR